jgi:protein ImuB
MIACVLYPRFELVAALGGRRELLSTPSALAPEAGQEQKVGEVSAAAEAYGVVRGMRVGEALSRCPGLRLVPPDPQGVRELWGQVLDRLEAIGAEVESDRAGVAYFAAGGVQGLYGGSVQGVIAEVRRALGRGVRLGAAPSRFSAHAAALQARPRRSREVVVEDARRFLAPLHVGLLRARPELQGLPEILDQLGIRTLGELAAIPPRAMAERFGHPGLLALDLASGRDTPLDPRRPPEPVSEQLELPEAVSGPPLERALELLVARVLARRERRGRSLRALALSARFVAGGTWRETITLREPSADQRGINLTLRSKVEKLPAPADSLRVEVEAFGPPAHAQQPLVVDRGAARRARLGEAVRQVRQAAGSEAAMRVLEVDPDSRLPERRAVLSPFLGRNG